MEDEPSASNPDQNYYVILSDVVCHNYSFFSSEISVNCENHVRNELNSDYDPYGVA